MIIHISGFPGSGKTTLGEKVQKMLGSKVIVYDTDLFDKIVNLFQNYPFLQKLGLMPLLYEVKKLHFLIFS